MTSGRSPETNFMLVCLKLSHTLGWRGVSLRGRRQRRRISARGTYRVSRRRPVQRAGQSDMDARTGAKGYYVKRSTTSGRKRNSTSQSTTSYADNSVSNGTQILFTSSRRTNIMPGRQFGGSKCRHLLAHPAPRRGRTITIDPTKDQSNLSLHLRYKFLFRQVPADSQTSLDRDVQPMNAYNWRTTPRMRAVLPYETTTIISSSPTHSGSGAECHRSQTKVQVGKSA